MNEIGLRAVSAVGFVVLLTVAWVASSDRARIDRRTVLSGILLQVGLAFALLISPLRGTFFSGVEAVVHFLIAWSRAGAAFLFGPLLDLGYSFALGVLPIIIFMGSLFGVLYHLGWVQPVVRVMARGLSRTMRISGVEGLAAAANLFVGMIESGIVIRPYLARMTRSELFSFMTLGMSTIAGSVLVTYASILGGGPFAGHLVVASLISAPAALVVAKIMLPETEAPETVGQTPVVEDVGAQNLIDAAAEGGLAGMKLAINIAALLIAFVALIAMVNTFIGALGGLFGAPDLTLQAILGFALAPLAFLMGVPWAEAGEIGSLIGVKTVLNEFIAYQQLAGAIAAGAVSERSAVIAAYALCGFANFGSLAILLGGIQAIAPERRPECAELGLRSILAGTLATCMTGCLAGLIV
ncbi:MAG: NupC/NupG family nucleoside CNT transporter [bacterium]|nr:NupC/NupG family nucleoside CNT transporter [Deltaproteobacteria bacterium]MCP4908482.1 NupC/NupG family nucleoside CNT transporter [bacterium]